MGSSHGWFKLKTEILVFDVSPTRQARSITKQEQRVSIRGLLFQCKHPTQRDGLVTCYMTGQEKGDLLIQVTAK